MSADTNLESVKKFGHFSHYSLKNAGTQPKIPAHKKHTCDPLSPYVGIIQIRFWVKASAYSQPACASTPFYFTVIEISNCIVYTHHFCDDVLFSTTVLIIHMRVRNARTILPISSFSFMCIPKFFQSNGALQPQSNHLRHCLAILLQSFCPHKLRILFNTLSNCFFLVLSPIAP